MKTLYIIVLLICAGIFYSGCATILTGTHDRITFESKPDGAKIFIDGLDEGTTPTTVRVQRNIQHVEVSLRLDGYQTQTVRLKKEFNFISILNFLDPVGWIIDVATGAIFKYHPKGYFIELEPKKP